MWLGLSLSSVSWGSCKESGDTELSGYTYGSCLLWIPLGTSKLQNPLNHLPTAEEAGRRGKDCNTSDVLIDAYGCAAWIDVVKVCCRGKSAGFLPETHTALCM